MSLIAPSQSQNFDIAFLRSFQKQREHPYRRSLRNFRNSTSLTPRQKSHPWHPAPTPAKSDAEKPDCNGLILAAVRAITAARPDEQLNALIQHATTYAQPIYEGEFTKDAVLNGMMLAASAQNLFDIHDRDLVQASLADALDPQNLSIADDEKIALADSELAQTNGSRLSVVCAANVVPEPVVWLWPGRIPLGKLTLIAGEPGIGKSQITAYMAAVITTGGSWPDHPEHAECGNVLMFSAEDDAADTIRPRLDAAGADANRVYFAGFVATVSGKDLSAFEIAKHREVLERAIKNHKIRVIFLDPLNAFLGKIQSHEAAQVRGVLGPLTEMAARLRVAIVGVMHLTKNSATATALHRVVGSGAFTGVARAVHAVARERDTDRVLFVPAKSNLGRGDTKGLAFRIQSRETSNGIETSAIEWNSDPVDISADEAFAEPDPDDEGHGARSEAEDFLREVLRDGSLPSAQVEKLAEEAGVSASTLKRAKRKIGVKSERVGGLGSGGSWVMSLPPPNAANSG